MAQAGIVYRYFPILADHDVSADVLAVSLDGVTWTSAGVNYVAPNSWPPSVTAAAEADPPPAGFSSYWWQVLTGPGQTLPLATGRNVVYGMLTDNPEIPHFGWVIQVGAYE